MPERVEYRITFHRIGDKPGMFSAPGFTAIILAKCTEDAVGQAERMAMANAGQYQVVDIRPANSASTPASPDDSLSPD
jgi:hypothetical protein